MADSSRREVNTHHRDDNSSSHRQPLLDRSNTQSNKFSGVRLVPKTPPQLLGQPPRDDVYSRAPLPTLPAHFLGPGKSKGSGPALEDGFQQTIKAPTAPNSTGTIHAITPTTSQPRPAGHSPLGSPASKTKPLPKKRLHVHKDNKTFSLLQEDPSAPAHHGSNTATPPSASPTKQISSDVAASGGIHAQGGPRIGDSCASNFQSIGDPPPTTPASKNALPIYAHGTSNSPWNYQFVGGLRKVAKTPDLKQKSVSYSNQVPVSTKAIEDIPDIPAIPLQLSTKQSFQSTQSVSTVSETSNYKVYRDVAAEPPSTSDSKYSIAEESSPVSTSSVIHRPQTSDSQNDNYVVYGDPSPTPSFQDLRSAHKYSQESLVIPPLNPARGPDNSSSSTSLTYSKSRSGDLLRSGSFNSISSVISQQQAFRAIVGTGSIIQLPILNQVARVTGSWVQSSKTQPPRSQMNEHPHQWSSQLSTVLSESDSGSERGAWSDDGGISSPSLASLRTRRMPSISSSLAHELAEDRARYSHSRSQSIDPPAPAFLRNGQRPNGSPSTSQRFIGDQDEYGDGITDMQDLRARPSRGRLNSSVFSSPPSSDFNGNGGRTYTMRSNMTSTTSNSRSNSLRGSIPAWAKLYYGSGERKYLGAPGSSAESFTNSRTSSFRSGSPNTDHFPLNIYSSRRRPRLGQQRNGRQDSMEINPAPQFGPNGELINDPYGRRFRTWSMSSIWSPHLSRDRRAHRRTVLEPPSVNWSTGGGMFGRRNIQVVMFITGFIFPFGTFSISSNPNLLSWSLANRFQTAWIIAAFLPLPHRPKYPSMRERDNSTSNLDSSNEEENNYSREFGPLDEVRYESALWWRKLNRCLSAVGVLIIGSVVSCSF